MKTAKLFTNGGSQAVRLPKDCRFEGTDVGVQRLGKMVVIFPKDYSWQDFIALEAVSEDFARADFEAESSESNTEQR
ncbi:MAG: type II toxin-antitoxin system VapB family antitoxin [Oscillospiraceae bacterium]|jgi:antitoxin VapB|nr:type II toxin-antitoxin system VapB family antitoxin [Oscillospiraceae bacterium]